MMNLPKYSIPRDLERALKDSENDESYGTIDEENKFSSVLNELRNIDCLEIAECHFLQFLKLGLYLEEYQRRKDMSKLEMYRLVVQEVEYCSNNKFKIYLKNFNEDNSILNISDSLKIFEQKAPNIEFFLKVVNLCKDHIVVTASKRFCEKYSSSAKYNIAIMFNTHEFQCCHYALSRISSSMVTDYFFPVKKSDDLIKPIYKQYWFNRNVFNNPEQSQAVLNILSKSSFPAPYILYGPPGTGKTSTLVEVICQIWKLFNAYILICAPSNAACDVVTKRLLDYIPANNIYRMYSHSHEYSIIDEDIKKCCNYDDDGTVDDLKKVDFTSKKIIITTLCTSLRLEKLNLQFSYVFMDEAGQATQAEALLPLCVVRSSDCCQIVISGDYQQLGPSLRSKLAKTILGQSIIEKLVKDELYKKHEQSGYDPRYITKLIRNFRSSKDIIHISNKLFYENELIACRNKAKLNSFPVAFYAVEAMEQKTSHSKSSYNEDEINVVLFFIKNFVGKKMGNKEIRQEDIGIVTPFSLQASRLRKKLNSAGFNEVDVGTVEIYQGQEKEIIIITTVRSRTFVHDGVEHIGFLSNPKRFNVALTRAKTSLIVVGNPTALQTDSYWRHFMRFCEENNACRGDVFAMMDEDFYTLKELTEGHTYTIKKSIDLFADTFTILEIDDGKAGTAEKNNNFISKTSITTDNLKARLMNFQSISNRIIPVTTGGMNSLIGDICFLRNASESTNSINPSKSDINSTRNTSVTTDIANAPVQCTDINSTQDSPTTTDEFITQTKDINSIQNNPIIGTDAPVQCMDINSMQDTPTTTDEFITQTKDINSIQNNPIIGTDSLSTINNSIESISVDDNLRKCKLNEEAKTEFKKLLCTIL